MKVSLLHKRFSYIKAIVLAFSISLSSTVTAQVQITPATGGVFTPESLITNVFLGDGVEVTGVVFNGDPISVGYFTNGAANLEIDRGIIMTSGEAMEALGPNDATGNGSATNSTVNDPDLNAISTAGLNDVNIYEITFIPTSDTLRFRYVFASEEYPEYACTGFNDVFGFFITGPNPAGGMYNAENIAIVPDPADPSGLTFTNDPVTINMVNPGVPGSAGGTVANCSPPNGSLGYSQYYNSTPANDAFMQYDGYLDAFVAQAIVVPCQTYTMKLGVADAGDSAFDTAVFLEAKSFGTGSLNVEATTLSLDGTITEGCVEGTITFRLPNPAEEDYEIDYTIFGTATNGVDYQTIPTNLTIPAGDSMVSIPLIAWEDGITEGIESIAFDVQRDPCNRDTFYVYIRDNEIVPPELGPDVVICNNGTGVQLDGTLPIALPDPPTFTNNTVYDPIVTISDNNPPPTGTPPTIAPLDVFAVQPFTLDEGVIKSVCINLQHNWIDDIDIFLVSPGGQFIELTTDNGGDGNHYFQTCFTPDATVPINFPGPFAPASAAPFTGNFQPEGLWSDLWDGDNPTNGTWQLLVKDDQTGLDGRLLNWSICFNPLYQVFYEWEPSAGLSCADCPDPIADPDTTTTYVLTAYDTYGCEVYDTITVNVIDDIPAPELSCGTVTDNSVTVNWPPVIGANSYEVNVNGAGWITSSGPGSHTVGGLALNTCVDIVVRGVGDCNTLPDTVTCCTPNCVPPTPAIDAITNVSCYGESTGSVEVSASGNYPITEYSLNSVTNTTGLFNGLAAGTYTVFITDQVNCTTQIDFSIAQPDTLTAVPILIDSISCNGLSDGVATVDVSGGVYPYSFNWGTQVDSIASLLPLGTTSVTVTDANMCTAIASIIINEPDALSLDFDIDSLSCNASGDGTAMVLPSGGVGDYAYLWDANASGQTTQTASNLVAGSYSVTVMDANNCEISSTITVEENPPLQLMTNSTDASCNGVFDGTATVIVSGGAGGYNFSWNDPMTQSDSIATSLTVNTYEVTVTDADGCTATATASVDAPNAISVDVMNVNEISCAAVADGTASLVVNGGTPDYTYTWSDGGAMTPDRNDLPAGSHQVTVTDANSCFEVVDITIGDAAPIELSLDSTIVSCPLGTDGTATVVPVGGTGTYTYLWSSGAQTTATATNLSAGMQTVTVTDANSCSQVASIEVTEQVAMSTTTDSIPVNCFGESNGTAIVAVTGGNGTYTYNWAPNTGTPVGDGSSYTDLIAGNYTVTVTDIQGCSIVTAVEVSQPSELTATTSVGAASCDGAPDGTANVSPLGGVGPYEYLWSDGQTTATANNLQAISYNVTVTDVNNCTVVETVNIASPPPLSLSLDSLDVSCNGAGDGTATVIADGGSGSYSYIWDDPSAQQNATANSLSGGNYTVTVSDANDCTIVGSIVVNEPSAIIATTNNLENINCNGGDDGLIDITVTGGEGPYSYTWSNSATTQDISGLDAGDYDVVITDDGGCTETLSFNLTQPDLLVLNTDAENVNCYNGADGNINLSVQGGTPGYSYNWSGPNGYSNSIQDISSLAAGTYSVTVTDLNGCDEIVDVSLTQPLAGVETSVSPRDTICFNSNDGQATVFVTGGTAPYIYLWDNGQVNPTATNLGPGAHYVTVTDMEGCSYQDTAYVDQLEEISIELAQNSASCHDGQDGTASILSISYGGVLHDPADFQISWNTFPAQTSVNAVNLTGGETYTVSITDMERSCTAVQSITIDNPEEIGSTVLAIESISCAGLQDGTATVDGQGGTSPYSFLWSSSAGAQTTATATDLQRGIHQVQITDAEGCSTEINIEIEEPSPLTNTFQKVNVDCNGSATGSLRIDTDGGTAPYSYLWSNGATDGNIEAIPAGDYQLTITDQNGCSLVTQESISQPAEALSATITKEDVLCYEGRDGSIDINPTGGTAPYQYSLDGVNYNGVQNIIGLTAGVYTVYIKDARNCVWSSGSIAIAEPDPIIVNVGPDLLINLGDDAQLSSLVSNAIPPISYFWSPGDSLTCIDCPDPIAYDLKFGNTYYLQVVDANGCEGEDHLQIIVEKTRKVFVPTGFTPNNDGFNDQLMVHGKEGTTIKTFQVYDRWGELIFETTNFDINSLDNGWDGTYRGKEMNTGVYVWILEVEYVDGATETLKGNSTLIR